MRGGIGERLATQELREYLINCKGTLVADKGKQLRASGSDQLASGVLIGLVGAMFSWGVMGGPEGGSPVAPLLFAFLLLGFGIYYGSQGAWSARQVDRLVLKTGERTYEWRHGVYPSIQTVQGSLDDFAMLQLGQQERIARLPDKRRQKYGVWCLCIVWKDADRPKIALPFFVMDSRRVEADRAWELAEVIGQMTGLPIEREEGQIA